MDLKTKTDIELKAMAYDYMAAIEKSKQIINLIGEELQVRSKLPKQKDNQAKAE